MRETGRIDYVEFPAADLPLTKRFYSEAFGWRFQDYGPGYAAFSEGLDGGFDASPEAVKVPLVVLFSEDLEATQAAVVAAGGAIVVPIFSFPGGRRFHFRDPAGNILAVFTETPESVDNPAG
jgi:predicted enzyme related to lactoylglutathione lyase